MNSGSLRKHERFRSRFLRNQRDLIVYTPPGYAEQTARKFPVLYLHDGQNLFDGATSFIPGQDWHVRQTADASINGRVVEPLIIVGMYNTKARVREYTPTPVPKLGGGRADRYARFLVEARPGRREVTHAAQIPHPRVLIDVRHAHAERAASHLFERVEVGRR